MNKFTVLLLLLLSAPATLLAQDEVQPIIYNRVTLKLIPKAEAKVISLPSPLPSPKPVPFEKTDDSKKGDIKTKADDKKADELKVSKVELPPADDTPPPPPPRTPIDYTVEMKSPDFLKQTDFITHTAFSEHEGLLILIDPPHKTSITATQMVGMSDVIMINEDGIITKIAPNLNLSTLSEPISSGLPVRAFLYLKPGSVEQDRITPGDRFENSIFKTHPIILE